MKNKNGFLLAEETLKIIIAVICIAVLAYLIISIYFSSLNSDKLKQAQETLTGSSQSIESAINRVLSSGKSESFYIANPQSWYLFSFTDQKPNSCGGKNCICICDKVTIFYTIEKQITECSDNGVCTSVEQLENFEPIEIKKSTEGLTSILLEKDGNKLKISV
jgi:type II secretory pathway pseudopilin PulG